MCPYEGSILRNEASRGLSSLSIEQKGSAFLHVLEWEYQLGNELPIGSKEQVFFKTANGTKGHTISQYSPNCELCHD